MAERAEPLGAEPLGRALPLAARSAFARQRNLAAIELERLREAGAAVIDLSCGNPTQCGLGTDPARLEVLADARGARYQPDSLGLATARAAVARYYQRRGYTLAAADVLLTASTSEAYSYLFKLLCDPGDAVLVPIPSYPLFPYLAQLEGVQVEELPSLRQEGFRLDLAALARRLAERPRIKALILVHPNNPTGKLIRHDDALSLLTLLAERGVALIADEVFRDYGWRPSAADHFGSFASRLAPGSPAAAALRFTLSGLSKVALLPQAKLAWLIARGPQPLLSEVRARLEIIADSYLSVATAVQLAAPTWLDRVDALQADVHERLMTNLAALDQAIAEQGPDCPVRRLRSDAGWYALIEVPRTRRDEEWVIWLLQQERLLVHPGYFFDMDEPGTMVVSLLLPEAIFAEAIGRAVRCWSQSG